MPDDDRIPACPECDAGGSKGPYKRQNKCTHANRDSDPHAAYICKQCGHTFDEPHYRERHYAGQITQGLAKQLDEADPDAIGGDAA